MTTSAVRTVGVLGAGRMGTPIIGHLARKGFTVAAYDIDPARRDAVAALGCGWADGPAALGAAADVVLVCVGYDEELRSLMTPERLLKAIRPGTIVAVLATVHPRTIRHLAEAGEARQVHVVDSTVCRGGVAADAGTLLSFIGGEPAVVERIRPVLAAYSADIVHTGAIGSAQVAKAANNLIMWACLIANHEALALSQRFGVDVDALREALKMSSGDNYVLRNWGVNTMAWAEDDMAIVQEMAHEAGIGLPQAGLNREICRTLKPKRFKLDQYGV